MKKYKDPIEGDIFGELVVLKELEPRIEKKRTRRLYLVKCSCGKEFNILRQSLVSGDYKTCGHSKFRQNNLCKHRLYNIWTHIKRRCYDNKSISYKRYGARGISMCKEWRNSFLSFYGWSMENNYDNHLTIDRIDNSGDYNPQNCRWTTYKIQANNTRSNVRHFFKNKLLTISEICDLEGIKNKSLAYQKVNRDKYDILNAIEYVAKWHCQEEINDEE